MMKANTQRVCLTAGCSVVLLLCPKLLWGQTEKNQTLVDAPSAALLAQNLQQEENANAAGMPIAAAATADATMQSGGNAAQDGQNGTAAGTMSNGTGQPMSLTREQAEQIAIQNNPRIRASKLVALAEHQVYRETRSQYLPRMFGGMIAEQANSGSRFSVDGLRTTRLITHAGGGIDMHQLITDFGHTSNLIASSKLYEKAQNSTAMATRQDVILVTDQVFYSALESEAVVKAAQQTTQTRQETSDQITELTKNKLRSDIDLAFAEQNLAEAKLLLLDAQDQYRKNIDALSAVLGYDHPQKYQLVDDSAAPPLPPPDVDALVEMALKQRPDLMALDYDQKAAAKFSRAQHEQLLPTIDTSGVFGGTPVRDSAYFTSSWFGAVGVSLTVPIFNGFLYTAEASEASNRAKASKEQLRDLRNSVVRDVNDAWLDTNTAYQKIGVTQNLVQAANLGLDLAQARYKLGLSSIVELSQSQLQDTQAVIQNINARYAYELALAALNYQIGNLP
ncbi:MAG TPA: TolC family protein [Acidobacteriaceae bacterium]|jgi:outer membrane protein|nr:TolC family protein [Acidobacteriaceae bacterium]